jgi:vitamin B12 transporter
MKKLNKIKFAVLPIVTLSCLSASEVTEEAVAAMDLQPYVVVATRTPLELDRVSPSVSYISAEEMEFWQDRSVVDALERQSGLAVKTNGAPGNLSSLFIRGTESYHTSVFLDGRRLNTGLQNQYNIEHLQVDGLSSAQLQKGASSVNYGSAGIGGVVDLQSKSVIGQDTTLGSVEGEMGSNSYRRVAAGFSYGEQDWGVSFGGSFIETDNERENDEYESISFTTRAEVKLAENLTAELLGMFSDSDNYYPGKIGSVFSGPGDGKTNDWLVSPGFRYATDEVSVHAFYSYSDYEYSEDYGDDIVETDEFSLQVDYTLDESSLLSAGGVYRNDDVQYVDSYNKVQYNHDMSQAGVWAQLITFVSDDLELRGGVRHDDYSEYDNSTDGSFEAIYTIKDYNLSVFAKVASSYAPPKAVMVATEQVDDQGTPLKPESAMSYELGLRQKLFEDKVTWELVVFRNEIDDLIGYAYPAPNYKLDYYNVDKASINGFEFGVAYAFTPIIDFAFNYTYLSTEGEIYDSSAGKLNKDRLAYRPRHTVNASVNCRPNEVLRLGVHAIGQFDRPGSQYDTKDPEDFVTCALVADWAVSGSVTLFGRVDNLFDKEYDSTVGYPVLGRAAYIGARLSF